MGGGPDTKHFIAVALYRVGLYFGRARYVYIDYTYKSQYQEAPRCLILQAGAASTLLYNKSANFYLASIHLKVYILLRSWIDTKCSKKRIHAGIKINIYVCMYVITNVLAVKMY